MCWGRAEQSDEDEDEDENEDETREPSRMLQGQGHEKNIDWCFQARWWHR